MTHPAQDTNVTLVAEITSGSAAETKRFQRTVTGTGSGSGSGSRPAGGGSGGGGGTSPRLPESSDRPQPTAKPEDPNAPFADLGQAAWAGEYILGLYEQGVVSGKAEKAFMPLDNVTREEFVKMLALVFELETEKTGAFSDVEAGAWYAPYVGGAWRAGLVNGVADGVFGVGQNITRQDMAVMTWRAAEAAGLRLGREGRA